MIISKTLELTIRSQITEHVSLHPLSGSAVKNCLTLGAARGACSAISPGTTPHAVPLHVQVALYTASVAADITTTRRTSGINGFEDLPGLRVATWNEYVDNLHNMSIAAAGYSW